MQPISLPQRISSCGSVQVQRHQYSTMTIDTHTQVFVILSTLTRRTIVRAFETIYRDPWVRWTCRWARLWPLTWPEIRPFALIRAHCIAILQQRCCGAFQMVEIRITACDCVALWSANAWIVVVCYHCTNASNQQGKPGELRCWKLHFMIWLSNIAERMWRWADYPMSWTWWIYSSIYRLPSDHEGFNHHGTFGRVHYRLHDCISQITNYKLAEESESCTVVSEDYILTEKVNLKSLPPLSNTANSLCTHEIKLRIYICDQPDTPGWWFEGTSYSSILPLEQEYSGRYHLLFWSSLFTRQHERMKRVGWCLPGQKSALLPW